MRRAVGLAAVLVLLAPLAAAQAVGVRELLVNPPQRSGPIRVHVWYPAAAEGKPVTVGGNAVFRGAEGLAGASAHGERLPLAVIAHGGFRAAPDAAGWLARALAAEGVVAAVVNPPPLPDGPATPAAPGELWLRPADLSATISRVVAEPGLAPHVDPARVAAVGVHLGGYSVLALAGARLDPAAYARSCDGGAGGMDCAWFARGKVDLRQVDAARLGRSNLDARLRLVVAVAPELTEQLDGGSLASIRVPVWLAGEGTARLAAAIPGAQRVVVPGLGPFSAFPECTPKGRAILAEEGAETALCEEPNRAAVHREIAAAVGTALAAAGW